MSVYLPKRVATPCSEIDGVILLDGGSPGDWVTAEITGGYGTDLIATVVEPR